MTIYTQSALLAAIVLLALAVGVWMSGRRTRSFIYFGIVNFVLSVWNLTGFLYEVTQSGLWDRVHVVASLFIPISSLKFFQTWFEDPSRLSTNAARVIGVLTLMLIPVVFSPLWDAKYFLVFLFFFIVLGLYLCMALVWRQLLRSSSPVESARLRYLAIGGLVAITLSVVAYIPGVEEVGTWIAYVPSLGNVVMVVFMYFLSQILLQYRLLDFNELVGKLSVLVALVVILATIYGVLAVWIGDEPGLVFFNTVIAAFVILILFEPMKAGIEERINRLLFRDRFAFARQLAILRREIANVVEIDELVQLLLARLENTRRVTQVSLYVLEDDALHYRLAGSIGDAPLRLEVSQHRHFILELKRQRYLVREELEATLAEFVEDEDHHEEEVETINRLRSMIAIKASLNAALCLPVVSDDRVIGLLNVNDDRMREAYAPEDVRALVQIAAQAAISIENSRAVAALREKDRLAALGEMAAGLAHEIRNPLGAIKGAAQYLHIIGISPPDAPPHDDIDDDDDDADETPEAFLDIIIDETNRLNTVVTQFLDYARPYRGELTPIDVNHVAERTLPLFAGEAEAWGVALEIDLAESLPESRGNAETLRQVFLNLALNAIQATGAPPAEDGITEPDGPGAGGRPPTLTIRSGVTRRVLGVSGQLLGRDMVEVVFKDNGKGIPEADQANIFIPFFTTRQKGTGLGLAISQRIVENMGGRIELDSTVGEGTTFRVVLPVWETGSLEPTSAPQAPL